MYNMGLKYDNKYYSTERNAMTIVVGAKCKNSVIIASDSQASSEEDSDMELGVEKIQKINNDLSFIYANAGDPHYCQLIMEGIQKSCEEIKQFKDLELFEKICEGEIDKVVRRYVINKAANQGLLGVEKLNIKEWQQEIAFLPFNVLLGIIFKNEPLLYRLTPNGEARKVGYFDVIGTGNRIGKYIIRCLKNNFGETLEDIPTLNSLLYIIDQVKNNDKNCGGETHFIKINTDGSFEDWKNSNYLNNFNEFVLKKIDTKYKEIWNIMKKSYSDEEKN